MNNPIISLEGVEKRFGSNLVVKKMNLEIAEGEFLTLLGHRDAERQQHCV